MNNTMANHSGELPEVVMKYDPVGTKVRLKSSDVAYAFSIGRKLANICFSYNC